MITLGFLPRKWGFYWRRRRDSNPRAGFPTYALSRGASSTCLSTSPNAVKLNSKDKPLHVIKVWRQSLPPTGKDCAHWRRRWDSNPRLLRVTGFQDRLLKPLGHLSKPDLISIAKDLLVVNTFWQIFLCFFRGGGQYRASEKQRQHLTKKC